MAAWVSILRIMGDLPESDHGETLDVAGVSIVFLLINFKSVMCKGKFFQIAKKDIEV